MSIRIISALVLRYLFLYTRTPMRLVELVFWPLVDLVVWGNVTVFIQKNSNTEFGSFILFFLGAMILWDVLFRAQQGVAISFLEDVWTRNLLNVFVAPVRTVEYLSATFFVGFLRILVTCVVMGLVSWIGYSFNITPQRFPLRLKRPYIGPLKERYKKPLRHIEDRMWGLGLSIHDTSRAAFGVSPSPALGAGQGGNPPSHEVSPDLRHLA